MCGICGIYDIHGDFKEENVIQMSTALAHRGPDAVGHFVELPVMLGHRRLSILDLSEAANEPFFSRSGRYIIVYNGEVYNFQEIASALNISPRTSCDTEIVLEAYARLGPSFVHHLNGMFAIAIYDRLENRLLLFRDRIGIKPLFYYWDGRVLLFASELKAIRQQSARLQQVLSRRAITAYLSLGFIPAPLTAYTNTFKLCAGHWASFDGQSLTVERYWSNQAQITPTTITDEEEATAELSQLLTSSVEYCLLSDRPVGILLSGGVDSSLVTAVAQSISKKPIKTFSVGFRDSSFNEAPYARRIAEHLGTEHQEVILTEEVAVKSLCEMPSIYDEPFGDHSAAPSLLISSFARRETAVAITGDGGDELFLGYGAYAWARRMANPWLWGIRHFAGSAFALGNERFRRAGELIDAPNRCSLHHHIFSNEQYVFSPTELARYLAEPFAEVAAPVYFHPKTARKLGPEERQALFDLDYYLPDDLLTKVDRASMQSSLEVRVPLLDYRLVQFALNLNLKLKSNQNTNKYLLKKILSRYMPLSLFNRAKRGFAIPLSKWMKNDLRWLEETYLNPSVVAGAGVFRSDSIAELRKRFHRGEDRLHNRLWLAIMLHKWMLDHGIR